MAPIYILNQNRSTKAFKQIQMKIVETEGSLNHWDQTGMQALNPLDSFKAFPLAAQINFVRRIIKQQFKHFKDGSPLC